MSIPAHHSTESTPGDRGRGLGAAQADRIAATADVYLRLFRLKGLEEGQVLEFGAEALDRIGDFSPELGDEIAGIAAGSGLAPELIGALNARTELLAAGRGECSAIACLGTATSSGTPIGVQTWDWHDELVRQLDALDDRPSRRPSRRDHDRGRHRRQGGRLQRGRRDPDEHPRPPR